MPIWENFMLKVYEDKSLGYDKGIFERPTNQLNTVIDCELYDESANPSDSVQYDIVEKDDFM